MGLSTHFLDTGEEQFVKLIYSKLEYIYILHFSEIIQ